MRIVTCPAAGFVLLSGTQRCEVNRPSSESWSENSCCDGGKNICDDIQSFNLLESNDMGLESFNNKPSRRDVLKVAGALFLGANALKMPAAATQSIEAPIPPIQPEAIPTPESVGEEEVRAVLRNLLGDTPYEVTINRPDADGLQLFEIDVKEKDGHTEYTYSRGRAEKGELHQLRIDKAMYYLTSAIPCSGHQVAVKTDGVWKLTP